MVLIVFNNLSNFATSLMESFYLLRSLRNYIIRDLPNVVPKVPRSLATYPISLLVTE